MDRVRYRRGLRQVRTAWVVGLGAVLLVAGCGGAGGTTAPSPATAPSTTSPTTAPSIPLGAGTWRFLPAAPVPSGYYAGVWTGTELVIHEPASNGTDTPMGSIDAAYNPATNSWRRLPANAIQGRVVEGGYRLVWTGTEVLAFGMMDAAYNPSTNAWRPLSAGPAGPSVTVWTGRQVLSWGGGCCGSSTAGGSVYDPTSNVWSAMPSSPLSARHADGVWTGTELVIIGGRDNSTVFADGAAYNPSTRTWRRLPALPSPVVDASITWIGTEVLVVGGTLNTSDGPRSVATAMAYNPAKNTWRSLADMPVARDRHLAVWTGQQLIVWGGEQWQSSAGGQTVPPYGVAYDPTTNRWAKMPVSVLRGRTEAVYAWTGTDLLIWGGIGVSPAVSAIDGAAFQPADG